MTLKKLKGPLALGASLIILCCSVATLAYAVNDIQKTPAESEQEVSSEQQKKTQVQSVPGRIASISQNTEQSQQTQDKQENESAPEELIDEDASEEESDLSFLENSYSQDKSNAQQDNAEYTTESTQTSKQTAHHSAYWKEAVYKTVFHNAGTCSACGKHHESSFTERCLEKYIEHVCESCGQKHSSSYDE